MKKYIILFIILLGANNLFADDNPSLGIGTIDAGEGVTDYQMNFIEDFIYDSVYRMGTDRFTIIARSRRDSIIDEMDFSLSGLADEEKAIEIGRLLGAEFMIFGNCGQFTSKYYLTLQIIDVTTSSIIGTCRQSTTTIDDIERVVDASIAELLAVDLGLFIKYEYPSRGLGIGLLSTGLASIGGGFLTYYFSTQYEAEAVSALSEYQNASTGFDTLWNTYVEKEEMSQGLFYTSIGLWAGGAILSGVSFFLIFDKIETSNNIALNIIPKSKGVALAFSIKY